MVSISAFRMSVVRNSAQKKSWVKIICGPAFLVSKQAISAESQLDKSLCPDTVMTVTCIVFSGKGAYLVMVDFAFGQ